MSSVVIARGQAATRAVEASDQWFDLEPANESAQRPNASDVLVEIGKLQQRLANGQHDSLAIDSLTELRSVDALDQAFGEYNAERWDD